MNKRLSIEEYGYQDFILVKCPQDQVLEALKSIAIETDVMTAPVEVKQSITGKVLKSLIKRARFKKPSTDDMQDEAQDGTPDQDENTRLPFNLHVDASATEVGLLTTERGPAYSSAANPDDADPFQDDMRLSAIEGSDWLLIEYREMVTGMSMLAYELSIKLEGRDLLYFRRSGDLISEYHNDFHVYQDGETLRRVLCHSTWAEGDIEQEWWESIQEGEMTVYEPETLYEEVGEMDLLDNDKVEEILAKLALSSQKLFSRVLTRDCVLLSRRPGGAPLVPID